MKQASWKRNETHYILDRLPSTQLVKSCKFDLLSSPMEKEMATHSIILAWMDRGGWQATVHGVAKELDTI